jgi:CO dehydrogenase/acetyl-CoA synthase delta subunit
MAVSDQATSVVVWSAGHEAAASPARIRAAALAGDTALTSPVPSEAASATRCSASSPPKHKASPSMRSTSRRS